MFTSKITELNNKNFESIRPLVNLDSIYYEQISNKDSNFHIDRQTVYKHLVPFVNTSLNKDSIDVSAYNANKLTRKDGTIKLNSPIKYSKIENSSFVQLGSNYQYNLSDILYHFADKEFVSNEYEQIKANLSTKILNLQDYINDNISQVYININNVSNIINTSLTNISTYMHNIIPTFSVYIDNNINDTYNKVLDFSTYINNVDISINYINTSIAIYEKNIDNLNSIVNEYNNKDASTLTKVEIERLAVQLLNLLNTAPDEYKYEWVYTPEIFIKMINQELLCPGKIYNVLYYPRTIKTNIDTSVYEHNKFSMPIILEILAINEHDISYNVKAKNAIDTLTLLEKQNKQAIGINYINDNSVVNYINVYNMPLQNIYDATTTQLYSLKPVYLYLTGDETHEYFNPIFYDDLYGMLYLKQDGGVCTCNDSNIENIIFFLNNKLILQPFSFSETYILVMILLQYLEKQSGYKLINAKYKNIGYNIWGIIDTYSRRITKNIVEVNELLLYILGNSNLSKIFYFFDLSNSKNIFIQLFGTSFENVVNEEINKARAEYLNTLSIIYKENFTEEINFDAAFQYSMSALYVYIYEYPTPDALPVIQSYFNIYYDTNNSSGYMGLLYNGDNELYQNIITPDDKSLMKSNISQWLFSENDGAFYEKNPKSLQAGKIIPYESWKILIDPKTLKITHLIDEYNNEADYDFRTIPTFITFNMSQTGLNVLNEFQDDIFWQSYYRYAIDNSTYYIYLHNISIYEQTKENYTNYITQNNIIVDNSCNVDRFITNNFVISVSDGFMINQGLYYNILNSSLKTSNIDNIIIKNNEIIYLDNYSQLCFIGNNFELTNNIINIDPPSDNVSNNQCRSVVIRKSECLDNSIYIGNYYQITSDDTTSIESYQQGQIINSNCIDNYVLRIYTSKIIESNIFGSYIVRNNFDTSSVKLINVKGAPENIQDIHNSVLYGPEAAVMYATNNCKDGYYIAADLHAANI